MTEPRTCLVTGATSGIGRSAAGALLDLGYRLILAGRDEERLARTAASLKSHRGQAEIATFRCDLSLLRDARDAAGRIRRDFGRIDVLINNAGARFLRHALTEEGLERTLATNHLGPFSLTLSLMTPLRNAGRARIINVASGAHFGGTGPIENIRSAEAYDGKRQYAESKLAVVLFTVALAERLQGEGITVNALDPGAAASNFSRNNGNWSWMKHRLSYALRGQLRTPAKAAETIVYLATANDITGVTGRYFRDRREAAPSEISRSKSARDALWASSVALSGMDL